MFVMFIMFINQTSLLKQSESVYLGLRLELLSNLHK